MKLTVFSHKPCWPSLTSSTGYATDGGFPFQMAALSELFDGTTIVVPCSDSASRMGELPLKGHHLEVVPLSPPTGIGLRRKLTIPFWLLRNAPTLLREILRADAIHTPIPGDIGTIGMIMVLILRKPLFVRHCGNWFVQRTIAERFWKWLVEHFAGGRNVMLVTGGAATAPSQRSPAIGWIFSTTLTEQELHQYAIPRTPTPGTLRMIIVCRQVKEKGTDVVIESLPLIREHIPEVTLDVVGDGGSLNHFKALAHSLGLDNQVTFHGKLDHTGVIKLLQRSDLFCYPTSSSEGFPKVVLEAMACGLPVVTTRVSVLPQLVGNGCGLLIDEATPGAVAQAVLESVHDIDNYKAMTINATLKAQQYSLEQWRDTIGAELQAAWGPLNGEILRNKL